ncbi:hypothetical protein [Streptomyces monashensis]|uniref:hypothetical protein n=1 Tax=Streptomyces monashensis TaxID=1678012 RepID=UPI001160777A|nr:hypothetical protein [Streptomyces monashensis]
MTMYFPATPHRTNKVPMRDPLQSEVKWGSCSLKAQDRLAIFAIDSVKLLQRINPIHQSTK